jgi:hypothetical protein
LEKFNQTKTLVPIFLPPLTNAEITRTVQASKIYRKVSNNKKSNFSVDGNEVAWEPLEMQVLQRVCFFETINAAGTPASTANNKCLG